MNYCATRKANRPGEAPEYIILYVCDNLYKKVVARVDVYLTDYSSRKPVKDNKKADQKY